MFDSIGKSPGYYGKDLEYFLVNNSADCKYAYNTARLQNYGGDVCGKYGIAYCIHRAAGYSLRQILDMFDSNLSRNDAVVENFYDRLAVNKLVY